jgi:hypothetical protein
MTPTKIKTDMDTVLGESSFLHSVQTLGKSL